ncbi:MULTISPECIES: hypothetical protein [unclassified Streptomyces]|uniref:Uncharacterized protein n=1 Tax=Streptomyces sp. NBC_00060 TaxID=2975636 RepID=A0AAU2H9K2_9ACTN
MAGTARLVGRVREVAILDGRSRTRGVGVQRVGEGGQLPGVTGKVSFAGTLSVFGKARSYRYDEPVPAGLFPARIAG